MKRSHFLVLAGVLAIVFGLAMIIAPDQMLASATTISPPDGAHYVLRWLGASLLAIGVINILARDDPGSPALKGIMLGNIVLHVIAWALDLQDFVGGVVRGSGLAMGTVVHGLLAAGFVYYLVPRSTRAAG